jgi:ubiquinone/menaquinone biosynthesis C-methylase UbiE
MLAVMSSPQTWASGRYDAIGDRIAAIADEVVTTAGQRQPLSGAAVADLACGTGSAALAAAAAGARVTGVDITPELLAIAADKATRAGVDIEWITGDASQTGLPAAAFDAVVSNMGIIFVEPTSQVAEIGRLLKPGGTLSFSAWVPDPETPFFKPVVSVFGQGPSSQGPDQWGVEETIRERLAADFDEIDTVAGMSPWRLGTVEDAMHLIENESPLHVSLLGNLDEANRNALRAAFEDAMRENVGADGVVAFDAPYVVAAARRR